MSLENKETDKKPPRKRGWAGNNPQTYKGMAAAFNFLSTMVVTVAVGVYLARDLDKPWILIPAIGWGVFGNLFLLVRRLNNLETLYGKKSEEEDSQK